MKMIKAYLHNFLGDQSLSQLTTITIEAPKVVSKSDLEEILDVWQ